MILERGLLGVAALLTLGAPVSGGDRGFLFRPPSGTLTLRGGFDRAGAGGELFAFVTDRLTVSRGDFGGATLAAVASQPSSAGPVSTSSGASSSSSVNASGGYSNGSTDSGGGTAHPR